MNHVTRRSSWVFALCVFASAACASKTEPTAGRGGSNQGATGKPTVDCAAARNNAATSWETWATEIEQEKTNAANSHMNLQLMSEAAARGADALDADDTAKTRALGAKATLATLATLDQAYAPAVTAAREAALELRTPQGAAKHAAALQQAKSLLEAERAFDQQSLNVAAATAASIEVLDLPAAALDNPEIKAKLDAIKAKRAEAIAGVETMRASRLEKNSNEQKALAQLETAFAPCAK